MLDNALDLGMTEQMFWESTIAEIERYTESKRRVTTHEQKKQCLNDYNLALLIRSSVSTVLNGGEFPDIEEVYPELFNDSYSNSDNVTQTNNKPMADINTLRFLQFAEAHNKKFREKGGVSE